MVQEYEKYKSKDETKRYKNIIQESLEASAFNNKVTIKNSKRQGKITDKDKMKILESVMKSSVGWIRIKL